MPFMGLETELALSGVGAGGRRAQMRAVLDRFEAAARKHLVHVSDGSRLPGMFLANGGRLYRDAAGNGAAHTEITTPEVDNPDELVRQIMVTDRLVSEVAARAGGSDAVREIMASKINYCYANRRTSWGSHENISGRADPPQITPFLATRIVLTGCGGFVTDSEGVEFTISPRLHFLTCEVSGNTQGNDRGLWNTKDCPLANNSPRVHIIAGEGNQSNLSNWLKFGTTALVVAVMTRGGVSLPAGMRFKNLLKAAHRFALDPACKARSKTLAGGLEGAVAIQRHYLRLVEDRLAGLPEWAPALCRVWRRTLDGLDAGGSEALAARLDWCIKRELVFGPFIRRSGWSWEKIAAWNGAVARLRKHLRKENQIELDLRPSRAAAPGPALKRAIDDGWLHGDQVDPAELEEFATMRSRLRELDMRYMQIGPDSLFAALDRAGALDHRVEGVPEPQEDPLNPPPPSSGRAVLRGALVARHGGRGDQPPDRFSCTWTRFVDHRKRSVVDLSDPECQNERWSSLPAHPEGRRTFPLSLMLLRQATDTASAALDSGDIESGLRALNNHEILRALPCLPPHRRFAYWKQLARIQARRQALPETLDALRELKRCDAGDCETMLEEAAVLSLLTLQAHPETVPCIAKVERRLANERGAPQCRIAYFRSHAALAFNRLGDPEAARRNANWVLDNTTFDDNYPWIRGRCELALAESIRLANLECDLEEAERLTTAALRRYRSVDYRGALADLALPQLAKLRAAAGQPEAALPLLEEARGIQKELSLPGILRTHFLHARLDAGRDPATRLRLRREAEVLASLRSACQHCPLTRKILFHWNEWCAGQPDPEPSGVRDAFWGV